MNPDLATAPAPRPWVSESDVDRLRLRAAMSRNEIDWRKKKSYRFSLLLNFLQAAGLAYLLLRG